MKKLALNIDDLRVESFDTSATEADRRGTVEGHQMSYGSCVQTCYTCEQSCNGLSCASCPGTCNMSECYGDSCYGTCDTCQGSCYGTCYATCGDSCSCDAYCV